MVLSCILLNSFNLSFYYNNCSIFLLININNTFSELFFNVYKNYDDFLTYCYSNKCY